MRCYFDLADPRRRGSLCRPHTETAYCRRQRGSEPVEGEHFGATCGSHPRRGISI